MVGAATAGHHDGRVREGRQGRGPVILQGKTVIVSGVGPGLGLEIAKVVMRDGGNVVLGARNEEKLQKLAADLDDTGSRVAYRRTDITDAAQCEALVATAVDRFGGVDGLAQVAALDAIFGGVTDTSVDDWNASFSTNVLGPVHLVRHVAPVFKKRGGGSVVLIGSQSMYLPQVPQIAYAAAKGALMSAMYYMAKELGPDKVRVNTVVPTWMWGPPVQGYVAMTAQQQGVSEAEVVAGITGNMPLGEIPADEDVAEAVAFLLSARARMITGQSLFVNAGELMR
jgi:NAD(P)-dependent dehydrogenase (short-subunit alcohol dehydrogenase family)